MELNNNSLQLVIIIRTDDLKEVFFFFLRKSIVTFLLLRAMKTKIRIFEITTTSCNILETQTLIEFN